MKFKEVDLNTWDRKEYFKHFIDRVPFTYSMSIKLDITNIRNRQLKVYPTLLYCITKAANQLEQFKTSYVDGKLVIFESMNPSYTIFHKDTKTFSVLWSEFHDQYQEFLNTYNNDLEKYSNVHQIYAKENMPANILNITMLPWVSFEGLNQNIYKGEQHLSPIFTMGKFYEDKEKIYIPLSIQVHHAVCDGYHVSLFVDELQKLVNEIK